MRILEDSLKGNIRDDAKDYFGSNKKQKLQTVFQPVFLPGVKKEQQQTNSYKKSLINNVKTTSCHDANLFLCETINVGF